MDKQLQRELEESLYLHTAVLPVHQEGSLEARFPDKKVLRDISIFPGSLPEQQGRGTLEVQADSFSVTAPFRCDSWKPGLPPFGDYCNFGEIRLRFSLDRADWQEYNRVIFRVKPEAPGSSILHLNVGVKNDGRVKVPDPYFREGGTVFDLKNGEWNTCCWEFAAMPRDAITELAFYVFLSGHDPAAAPELHCTFADVRLQQIEQPEVEHGWQCQKGSIVFSTVGYWPVGTKIAIANREEIEFSLVDAENGTAVFSAPVRVEENVRGSFRVLDFTEFTTPGRYYLRMGDYQTEPFALSKDLAVDSVWRVLNFIFSERCGYPVPGRHAACHQDVTARWKNLTMSFSGGWHDAGDVSQQALQSAEAVQALLEAAQACPQHDSLRLRLEEEARWGLDFILRTRFGQGYRATSAGATRWTDGLIGDFDDIPARVHDHAFENFLFSGVEAYAAVCLKSQDPALAWRCTKAAKEDFGFAEAKFAQTGVDPAEMFEHTFNSGYSQYCACATWAASQIYVATADNFYAEKASAWGDKLLKCQETGDAGYGIVGFFYREPEHKTIVHFNHQAREHQFAQALDALCRTQPDSPNAARWRKAAELYGSYLLAISGNTFPYGMLPAGLYRTDEPEDKETFRVLHVSVQYEKEKENYVQQLKAGTPIAKDVVLRNFPVWFSFRGNDAVLLSMGKSATLLGKLLGKDELIQLGREQLYWTWGKNPFGQSLVYGSGSNWCRQYAVLCGETTGEVPVGIETLDNEDVPYWPQNNNATFREVWIAAATHWLRLAAEFIG